MTGKFGKDLLFRLRAPNQSIHWHQHYRLKKQYISFFCINIIKTGYKQMFMIDVFKNVHKEINANIPGGFCTVICYTNCTVLYCTAVQYSTVLYCTVLYCTAI